MTPSKFAFDQLVKILGRSVNDPEVLSFFGKEVISDIQRDEYYGSLEFKSDGVNVVFNEAPWVLPSKKVADPKELYLAAFHLHSKGYEDYAEYCGQLPKGINLGNTEAEVLLKMGQQPLKRGGGGSSPLLGPIPNWLQFPLGDAILHFQFDANGRVNMATLQVPEVNEG